MICSFMLVFSLMSARLDCREGDKLECKTITRKSDDFRAFKALYKSSFPRSERAPIWFLLSRARKDNIRLCVYCDKGEPVGLANYVLHNDLTYVVYLAVCENRRSEGYGSRILGKLKADYPGNRIVLTIEMVDERAGNNEQRMRRKRFYEKNGFAAAGINVKHMGGLYELLAQGGSCSVKEFDVLSKIFIGSVIYPLTKPKIVRVVLTALSLFYLLLAS